MLSHTLEQLIDAIQYSVILGVADEIDQFMPESWSFTTDGDMYVVRGPWSSGWMSDVQQLCSVIAYREGSLLRKIAHGRYEFYTWIDAQGQGFKVLFEATFGEQDGEPPISAD